MHAEILDELDEILIVMATAVLLYKVRLNFFPQIHRNVYIEILNLSSLENDSTRDLR